MDKVIEQFLPVGSFSKVYPFGGGHINDTFAVEDTAGEKRWILQRINHHVFPRVEVLQQNIKVVSEVLDKHLVEDPERARKNLVYLNLLSEPEKNYYYDGENYWRMCNFIPRSKSLSEMNPGSARYAGEAFGKFQEMLAEIPEGVLGETIERFHSMPWRLEQLAEVVERDPEGRVAECRELLDEIYKRREEMLQQEMLYKEGKLPKRTIHCDTKVDNILFDEDGSVLCVVDWDTVMPGFILSDVGDFIRTAVNTAAEDEVDLDKIDVDMEVYKAFIEGYLSSTKGFLTPLEKSMIAYGGRLMTYMQTVRFLADHLDGDHYFKIHRPNHNLERARAQFRYLQRLEERAKEMEALLS